MTSTSPVSDLNPARIPSAPVRSRKSKTGTRSIPPPPIPTGSDIMLNCGTIPRSSRNTGNVCDAGAPDGLPIATNSGRGERPIPHPLGHHSASRITFSNTRATCLPAKIAKTDYPTSSLDTKRHGIQTVAFAFSTLARGPFSKNLCPMITGTRSRTLTESVPKKPRKV